MCIYFVCEVFVLWFLKYTQIHVKRNSKCSEVLSLSFAEDKVYLYIIHGSNIKNQTGTVYIIHIAFLLEYMVYI